MYEKEWHTAVDWFESSVSLEWWYRGDAWRERVSRWVTRIPELRTNIEEIAAVRKCSVLNLRIIVIAATALTRL